MRVVLSFLLCVSTSILSCSTLLFLKRRWATCSCIRVVVPVIFGVGISGANALALSGTAFLEHTGTDFTISRAAQLYWDGITLCTLLLARREITIKQCVRHPFRYRGRVVLGECFNIGLKDFARNKWRCPIPPSPKITIASIAFSSEGRVLVDDRGLLPMQVVDLDGLNKVSRIASDFDAVLIRVVPGCNE